MFSSTPVVGPVTFFGDVFRQKAINRSFTLSPSLNIVVYTPFAFRCSLVLTNQQAVSELLACYYITTTLLYYLYVLHSVLYYIVAQLVKRSLPTPEIRGSNSCHRKIVFTINCIKKTKIKKKEALNGPIKRDNA